MQIRKKIDDYLFDNKFKINITDKYVNIVAYDEVVDFSSNKIIVKNKEKLITIEGKDLIISKMMDNELLINGLINNISINK